MTSYIFACKPLYIFKCCAPAVSFSEGCHVSSGLEILSMWRADIDMFRLYGPESLG